MSPPTARDPSRSPRTSSTFTLLSAPPTLSTCSSCSSLYASQRQVQDFDHLLPPSAPCPGNTPFYTPLPSAEVDDYFTQRDQFDHSIAIDRSPSTRTSISTSTSGWSVDYSETSGNSSDELASPNAGWWGRRPHRSLQHLSISLTLPTRRGGTRSWGWLKKLVVRREDERGRTWSRGRESAGSEKRRETERLISNHRRARMEPRRGREVSGTLPYRVRSITLVALLLASMITGLTLLIKHALNPDKVPLPWRSYCSESYPTHYSLQHTANHTSLFATEQPLSLLPLTPDHPHWPYPTAQPPSNLSELELPPVGVLVGVFTTDAGARRRNMIRQSYGSHWRSRRPGTEGVRVLFVMGRPRRSLLRAIELESEAFGDILILDIPENMNQGKTHAFFSWAAANATVPDIPGTRSSGLQAALHDPSVTLRSRKPDWVVKADDDSFIMLGELERRLRAAPKSKAFWGYLVKDTFMAGEAYALTSDLVSYIATSRLVKANTHGKEDQLVADWMRMHPQAEEIVWVTERCWVYDHPKAGTVYSHGFLFPSTVQRIRDSSRHLPWELARSIQSGNSTLTAKEDSFSTVTTFGRVYRPRSMTISAGEAVEALIEESPVSLLRADHVTQSRGTHDGPGQTDPHLAKSSARKGWRARISRSKKSNRAEVNQAIREAYASRPSQVERFLGDENERGGTVVVHYIKKDEWFMETWLALLGGANEDGPSAMAETIAPEAVGVGFNGTGRERETIGGGETSVKLVKQEGL